MDLETFLRMKLREFELNHDYSVPTDTVRAWLDLYNDINN